MTPKEEESLRRRRERGRRSQAGFRKRQANAQQQTQEENLRLRTAIEKVANSTFGDERQELLDAISELAGAAGLSHPTHTAKAPIQTGILTRDESGKLRKSQSDSEEVITINAVTREYVCHGDDHSLYGSCSSDPSSTSRNRLMCGIWVDPAHYMRVSIPPEDILPYLGQGSKTLAGNLFWSVMDHTFFGRKCPKRHHDATEAVKKGLGHSKVTQDWAPSHILAMMEARKEFQREGSCSGKYAAAMEADLGMILRDQIIADYKERGLDPDQWISVLGIEKRLRAQIDGETFARVEEIARGGGSPTVRRLYEDLLCDLQETGICFGDGPRWSVTLVDRLLFDLLHTIFWSA